MKFNEKTIITWWQRENQFNDLLTLHNPTFASPFVTQYGAEKPAINKIRPEKLEDVLYSNGFKETVSYRYTPVFLKVYTWDLR